MFPRYVYSVMEGSIAVITRVYRLYMLCVELQLAVLHLDELFLVIFTLSSMVELF